MGKKILVVDDEEHYRHIIQVSLERAGYQVITALDGVEALQKVRDARPDLTILDDYMSPMDGLEVLKNIKSDPETQGIPIIMIATRSQDIDLFRAWQAGVDVYLTKPFNILEVMMYVKKIFRALGEAEG